MQQSKLCYYIHQAVRRQIAVFAVGVGGCVAWYKQQDQSPKQHALVEAL